MNSRPTSYESTEHQGVPRKRPETAHTRAGTPCTDSMPQQRRHCKYRRSSFQGPSVHPPGRRAT
eukprot:6216498-Prymnesium_polylepis.1